MKNNAYDIYGRQDPRDLPVYTVAEAARYLGLSPATLRSWVVGRRYPRAKETAFFEPIIQPCDSSTPRLSFKNLVEAHVLRALRAEHKVSIKAVRLALNFAEREYRITRLLLSPALRTNIGNLFIDKYGELVNLSKSGQIAIKKILQEHLERVVWDSVKLPMRLFPFLRGYHVDTSKVIVIDPLISFGRPVIRRKSISTAVIADRIDAGESVEDLAEDYNLEREEVEEAIIYERAA
jgi:uncharacterized protein (DUF433 family)